MFGICVGPISWLLPPAVHAAVYDLLRRADIEVTDYEIPGAKCIRKGSAALVTFSDVAPKPPEYGPVFEWYPHTSWHRLAPELERILFASGGRYFAIPDEEMYVSVGKEADFAELSKQLRESLNFETISDGGASAGRLPDGVILYQGPAADPVSGEARSYVSLGYPVFSLHPVRRESMLRQIRDLLLNLGLVRLSYRRFLGHAVPEQPWSDFGSMCRLPKAVHGALYGLFQRGDIGVTPNQPSNRAVYLSKGIERIATSINEDRADPVFHWKYSLPNSAPSRRLDPAIPVYKERRWTSLASPIGFTLHKEIERMLFASGSRCIRIPSAEIYISVGKEADFPDLWGRLHEALDSGSIPRDSTASSQLPAGIILHQGPAVDPATGAARSYVALDYPIHVLDMFHGFRRAHILRQVRKVLRQVGLERLGRRRFFKF